MNGCNRKGLGGKSCAKMHHEIISSSMILIEKDKGSGSLLMGFLVVKDCEMHFGSPSF